MSDITFEDYLIRHYDDPSDVEHKRLSLAAQLLTAAADIVDSKRWVPHKPVRGNQTCTVAAICTAMRQINDSDETRHAGQLAYLSVQALLDKKDRIGADMQTVTAWNDTAECSQEQSSEKLRSAAQRLQEFANV